MTVKDKIELLKNGVKMADIKELEKQEEQEKNPIPEVLPTPPAPEVLPTPPTPPAPEENKELEEMKKEMELLKAQNTELSNTIAKQNALFISLKDNPEEDINYSEVDVFKELFSQNKKKEV